MEDEYRGVEGFVKELGTTVRECIDCGCLVAGGLVAGGPTRCKRCAKEWDDKNAGKGIGTSPEAMELRRQDEDDWNQERDADVRALVKLSEELNTLGLRGLDQSSTRAAVIAIKTLKERINYFAQVTRKIMAEVGIPTDDDETPESRLGRIKNVLGLIDFAGILKILGKKEGVGK